MLWFGTVQGMGRATWHLRLGSAVALLLGACSAVDSPPFASVDGLHQAVAGSAPITGCAPARDETGGASLLCSLDGEPVLLTAYFGAETLERGRAWLESQGWVVSYGDGWTIASKDQVVTERVSASLR